MFLCTSYTNRYFENLKKINSKNDVNIYLKLQNKNLNLLKALKTRIEDAKSFLLNE